MENMPKEILVEFLSWLDIEEILKQREVSQTFKHATDSTILLSILSDMYNLEKHLSFNSLLEEYDKKNVTDRCLKYHPIDKCGEYFSEKGDMKGVEECIKRGFRSWNLGMFGAAQGGHKDLVQFFQDKINNK